MEFALNATPVDAAAAHVAWIAEQRICRDLRQLKCKSFWREKVRSEKSAINQSINETHLLGRQLPMITGAI